MTVSHVISDLLISTGDIDNGSFLTELTLGSPPGYSKFQNFLDGDYQYANALFREVLTAAGPDRPRIQNLNIVVDVPDLFDRGTAVIDSSGTLTVNFNRTFTIAPQVALGSVIADDDVVIRITSVTNTSFTITAKHSSTDLPAPATVSWLSHGY